eukprot:5626042-Pyramimonas_sp.AAC.1
MHAATAGATRIGSAPISRMATIPGVGTKTSTKGKKPKHSTLADAVGVWSHLLNPIGGGSYTRLDLNIERFEQLLQTRGPKNFGTWG